MDNRPNSDDPLAHFDHPKTLELSDFEWEFETIPIAPAGGADALSLENPRRQERFIEIPQIARRGAGWVLGWTGALVVLVIAGGLLAEFAYLASAEQALSIAARAGAIEATLPRATYQSVASTIGRRLARYPALANQVLLTLSQDGMPVQTQFRQREGDRITILLSAPGSAGLPEWLRRFDFRRAGSRIQAEAEQIIPGRKLALLRTQPPPN